MTFRWVVIYATFLPGASLAAQTQRATDSAIARALDGAMPGVMKRMDIPGAVLTIVHGHTVLLNKGYGVADRERSLAVSADSTVFRIGSVSKIFTAMAALQLEDSGKLRLDADIRPLVRDIRAGDSPLTMSAILTHTAGFDERSLGYLSRNVHDSLDLARVLGQAMPARHSQKPDVPGYSNHGYGLAGLAIERVVGMPFNRFVESRVFAPLGMTSTAYIIPPLPAVARRRAAEYRSTGERRDFTFSPTYPAGNVGTTGSDMARLLRALLGNDTSVLSSRARARLMGPEVIYHPQLPPMGLGLAAQRLGGELAWMKGGASRSHSGLVAVFPRLDLALFVAVNRQEPLVWESLMRTLGDSLPKWGGAQGSPAKPAATTTPAAAAGVYRWTRTPRSSVEKVAGLALQLRVTQRGDALQVDGGELSGSWTRIDTALYRRRDGRELGARVEANGRVTHLMSIVGAQPVAFERIPFYETTRFESGMALGGLALAIAAAVAAARAPARIDLSPWERSAIVALPVMEIATLVSSVMLARDGDALAFGPTPALYATTALTTATALVALAQVVASARVSSSAGMPRPRRTVYGAGAAGGLATIVFLSLNNLIGFRF